MEDDLGLSLEEEPTTVASEEEDLSLEDDLGLSLEEVPAVTTTSEVEEDLSLAEDFDLSLEEEPTATASEAEEDLSLAEDFDLSLEEEHATTAKEELENEDSATIEISEEDLSFEEDLLTDNLSSEENQPVAEENEFDLNAMGLDEELTSELENLATTDNGNTEETDLGNTDDLESLLGSFSDQDLSELSEEDTDFDSADEISGQFDLAKMFIDMDDNESALGILEEISTKGNDEQKRKAKELMEEIA